jgi:tetratricopeptide (TPR) repeat protein
MVDLILPFDAALRYARSWWERMRPFDINNFTIDYEREFGAADVLFAEGHYRKAIEAYDQTIRANPLVADFLVVGGPRDRKGRAHEELGQYEMAVKSYSEVLRSHPTPFNYETRGLAYHRLGEYEHAIQDFDWDWGKPEGSASPVTSAGD